MKPIFEELISILVIPAVYNKTPADYNTSLNHLHLNNSGSYNANHMKLSEKTHKECG